MISPLTRPADVDLVVAVDEIFAPQNTNGVDRIEVTISEADAGADVHPNVTTRATYEYLVSAYADEPGGSPTDSSSRCDTHNTGTPTACRSIAPTPRHSKRQPSGRRIAAKGRSRAKWRRRSETASGGETPTDDRQRHPGGRSMSDDSTETKQITLTGDTRTDVVNKKRTDRYTVDIGRENHGQDHMNSTAVGEPGWIGNPYPESEYGRERCIELFREDFYTRLEADAEFREAVQNLRGEILACYCKPKACHGDVIVAYLNENGKEDGE